MGEPRGTKRKRPELTEEDKSLKIAGKLHHDLREVRKAAKKAKIFETQKLVKKLKDMRKKEENLTAVGIHETQLSLLKDISHEELGTRALNRRMMKDKVLSSNEFVQAAMSKEMSTTPLAAAPPGTDLAKLIDRLLSSKVLAANVSATIADLRNFLASRPTQSTTIEEGHHTLQSGKKSKNVPPVKKKGYDIELEEPTTDRLQDVENDVKGKAVEENGEGWKSSFVEDDGHASDGWESGTVDEQLDEEESDSEDEFEGEGQGPQADMIKETRVVDKKIATPLPKPPNPSKAKASAMQSTFLPSLSVGFIRGDSDDSDMSDHGLNASDIKVRKNRRGQQARRAIWEKKYGNNANHKKREAAIKSTVQRNVPKNSGGESAFHGKSYRPQVKSAAMGSKDISQQHSDSVWTQRPVDTTSNRWNVQSRESRSDRITEKLHPSWEAKKKMKEKLNAGITTFQGTKIKFT